MANDFQAGDRVKFLDSDGEGVVIRYLDNNQILVESNYGFEEVHFLKDILPFESQACMHLADVSFHQDISQKNSRKIDIICICYI